MKFEACAIVVRNGMDCDEKKVITNIKDLLREVSITRIKAKQVSNSKETDCYRSIFSFQVNFFGETNLVDKEDYISHKLGWGGPFLPIGSKFKMKEIS